MCIRGNNVEDVKMISNDQYLRFSDLTYSIQFDSNYLVGFSETDSFLVLFFAMTVPACVGGVMSVQMSMCN